MKLRILLFFILTFTSNCFLVPRNARYNNSSESALLYTFLDTIANANSLVVSNINEVQEGTSEDFLVKFNSEINTTKTVTISSSSTSIVPNPSTLSFEVGKGTISQTVTLTSLIDNNSASEDVIVSFSSPGVETQNLTIDHSEPESGGNWIQFTGTFPGTIVEGNTSSLSISLNSLPHEDVTVNVASGESTVLSVSPSSLTFNSTNYTTPQVVTFSSVEDSNLIGERITITISASGMVSTIKDTIVFDNDANISRALGKLKTGRTDDGGGSVNRSFTDLGNNLILDNAARLIWQKCLRGFSGTNCETGTGSPGTWIEANNYCSTLTHGGLTWRLPTITELSTIINYNSYPKAFNTTYFPNMQYQYYWSSSYREFADFLTWIFELPGRIKTGDRITPTAVLHYAICVSGTTIDDTKSFTDNGDETITDNNTGLLWTKCIAGHTGNDCTGGVAEKRNWADAKNYCSSTVNLGYKGQWRLPNRNELQSLTDFSKLTKPVINDTYFPNTLSNTGDFFWSSTTGLNSINKFVTSYDTGFFYETATTGQGYFRCVKSP